MKAIDIIRGALLATEQGTAALVEDMRDAALVQPGVRDGKPVGNHALWLMGHLAYIEGEVPGILLGPAGGPNPVEHWASLFAPGTEPRADAGLYPSFDEVVDAYRTHRARTLALLDELGDANMDRAPAAPPPGFEESMRTFGETLMLITLHNMVHYGQIADARRAAGRRPLL